MDWLRGKVAWITGASSGIGEMLAYELSARGARLVLSARRSERLAAVQKGCQTSRQEVALLPLDLADSDSLPSKVREAVSFFGRIDLLINNAGISQRALAAETSPAVVRAIMQTNFFGAVSLTTEVVRLMQERKEGGEIVVVSSLAGKIGAPLRSTYAASKHALHGYFDSLRSEVAKDSIGILIVVPGTVRTEVSLHALERDGREHALLDERQAKGMSPQEAARRIVRAIIARKEEMTVGMDPQARAALLLRRFAPRLLSRALRRAKVL